MEQAQDDAIKEVARQFIKIFPGLPDARGAVHGECLKGKLTLEHVLRHLEGKESLGRYPIFNGKYIKWAAVDFDFKSSPDRKTLSERHAREFAEKLFEYGIKYCWLERSKSGLIHLWIFFREKVLAKKVRYILYAIARELRLKIADGIVEVFPKHDELNEDHPFGNYINLPYYGALNGETIERRVILDSNTLEPIPLRDFLSRVEPTFISEGEVDTVYDSLTENLSQDETDQEPTAEPNNSEGYSEGSWQIKREKIIEIFKPYWVNPARQRLSLRLADLLGRHGITWVDTQNLILEIAKLCGDNEISKRMGAVKSTYEKQKNGKPTNYKEMRNILSPEDFDKLMGLFEVYVFVEETEDDEETAVEREPGFPESVCTGLFDEYLDLVSKNSETSPTVHFGVFTSYLSVRLGRTVYYPYPRPMYPNFWVLNVDRTGQRRSTGLAYVYDLSADVGRSEFSILSGIASSEGLIRRYGDFEKADKNKIVWVPSPERQILLNLNEATVVLKVAKRDATSNLKEVLHDFYDYRPYIENPTKTSSIWADKPCLSIVAATTYGALKESFKETEITSGFFNRFCFFIGAPNKLVAHPTPPEHEDMVALTNRIENVINSAKNARMQGTNRITMDDDAHSLWESYYKDLREGEENLENELERDIVQRLHVFAIKYAMLYAAMDARLVISKDDIHKGSILAKYLGENALWVLRNLIKSESKYTALENRMLKFLRKNKGSLFSYGKLSHVAGGRYERKTLLWVLETLTKAALIFEKERRIRRVKVRYWGAN